MRNKREIMTSFCKMTSLLTLALGLSQVRAELVLEGTAPKMVPAVEAPVTNAAVPSVASPSTQAAVTPRAPEANAIGAGSPIILQQVQNSESQAGASQTSTQELTSENQSRVERIRRERLREEVKNEDALQSRLEELRLRSENERGSQINQFGVPTPAQETVTVPAQVPVSPVIVPVTSNSAITGSTSAPLVSDFEKPASRIGITPTVGFFKLTDTGGYDVQPRLAVGVGVDVIASDHVGVQFSYTYAQHNVWINSSNPYFAQFNSYVYNPGYPNYSNGAPYAGGVDMAFNQNVFEIGPKLILTKATDSVRPFIGVAGAYSYSYLNYSKAFIEAYRSASYNWYAIDPVGQDYTVGQFMGSLSAGVDLRLTDSLSFGALFKYYRTLASTQNGRLPYAALYYGRYGTMPGFDPSGMDKAYLGGSLAEANAYTVQANLSFHF